jgi:signal transduction histidine kinase
MSGHEMDAILDAMEEGILLVDTNDQVVLANRTAEAFLGRRLANRPVDEACDDPRWMKTYQIVRAASQLRGDTPGSELTGAMTRLAVSQRMLRAAFRLDLRPRQPETGTVVILTDVTAEREAERAKESFASAISQELRTPITSIIGYTDLLMGESVGVLEDAQRRFLSRVRANAEKIGGQLNSLLAMSSVDNRQLQVRAEAMDLALAVDEAVGAVRDRIIDREQMLDVSIEPDLPPVDADPDAMYHILTNLLENAHRCSPDGAHIVFRASRVQYDGEFYVSVAVTDAGGGLASEDTKRVFNRYYRSDSAHVAGLGDPDIMLPVVKVLVEAHGGRIWMESEHGVGTTFTTLFPQRGGRQA